MNNKPLRIAVPPGIGDVHWALQKVRSLSEKMGMPVDVYVAGCPPRPEALQDAVLQLRAKIGQESIGPNTFYVRKQNLPQSGDPR